MRLGDIRIDPLIDGIARVDPAIAYSNGSSHYSRGTRTEDWASHSEYLDSHGQLEQPIGGFVVRGADRILLVDVGLGRFDRSLSDQELAEAGVRREGVPQDGGHFMDELEALGISPLDVTDVLFTHLHTDHIGWATRDGLPVFSNATYRCDERDWKHFARPTTLIGNHLLPLSGQLELWSGNTTVAPGVDALPAPGHTPGSTVIVLSSGTDRAMLLGDVVHCPVQLLDDEWAGMGDLDPLLARKTREGMVREIESGGIPVAGAHFQGMQFGRLLRAEGRRFWTFSA